MLQPGDLLDSIIYNDSVQILLTIAWTINIFPPYHHPVFWKELIITKVSAATEIFSTERWYKDIA